MADKNKIMLYPKLIQIKTTAIHTIACDVDPRNFCSPIPITFKKILTYPVRSIYKNIQRQLAITEVIEYGSRKAVLTNPAILSFFT